MYYAIYSYGVHFIEKRPFARLISSDFRQVSETIVSQQSAITARHRRRLTFILIIAVIPAIPSRRLRLSVVGIGLSCVVIDTWIASLPVVFRPVTRVPLYNFHAKGNTTKILIILLDVYIFRSRVVIIWYNAEIKQ